MVYYVRVNAFNYFYKLWDHNKIKNLGLNNIVKTQIIRFPNLFCKVNKYLPDKINNYSKRVNYISNIRIITFIIVNVNID